MSSPGSPRSGRGFQGRRQGGNVHPPGDQDLPSSPKTQTRRHQMPHVQHISTHRCGSVHTADGKPPLPTHPEPLVQPIPSLPSELFISDRSRLTHGSHTG